MEYGFFAFLSRMKYIERWGLMRNSRRENISEHSLETAVLAHALAVIGNLYFSKDYQPERAATLAIFHDTSETVTGDMPTPVKYFNEEIKRAYKKIDEASTEKLLSMLPEKMSDYYRTVMKSDKSDRHCALVKAADTLSAYIKCIEERMAGNRDFYEAERSTLQKLRNYGMPEVDMFLDTFISAYEKTLDDIKWHNNE